MTSGGREVDVGGVKCMKDGADNCIQIAHGHLASFPGSCEPGNEANGHHLATQCHNYSILALSTSLYMLLCLLFTSLIMVLSHHLIQGKGVTIEWLLSWTESANKCMLT